MNEYQKMQISNAAVPNSHKSKAEQRESEKKRVEKPVVTNPVKTRKNVSRGLVDTFINEDAKNIKSYILMDVLVPAIKNAVTAIVKDGIDMLLWGETGKNGKSSNASKISYRNYYDSGSSGRRYANTSNSGYSYDDVVFSSRAEAEEVLTRMDELIDQYGYVTVGDLLDMAGITGNYTDNKYGWTNVSTAQPIRVRDGWIIKLPRVVPID